MPGLVARGARIASDRRAAAILARTAGSPGDGAASALLRVALAVLASLGLHGLDWLTVAPNRLLPGEGLSAPASLGQPAHLLALAALAAALIRGRGPAGTATLALVLAATIAVPALTGFAAAERLAGRAAAARAAFGPGFWLATASLALLALERAREVGPRTLALTGTALALGWVAAGLAGAYDALSLAVEYRARADIVQAALARHLVLSIGAVVLALAVAIPLGWLSFRIPRAGAGIGAALHAVQVVPAIALFGLLIPLLAIVLRAAPALREAGLGAIGPAPAILGAAAYLALPLVRAITGGLSAAPPASVEAARAMGMGEGRIAREVRLPLGMPVFAAGLRVAMVQGIGLVTLGGLVGAGGLGALVFEGLAQFAPDLILLGALPVVALAVAADLGVAGLARVLDTRR